MLCPALCLPQGDQGVAERPPSPRLPWLSHPFWLQKATDIFYKLKQQFNSS